MHVAEILRIIENVDPAVKPLYQEAFTPKGNCRVATSPNFVYIVSHLLKGRSPYRVSDLLADEKREHISPSVIRDYLLTYIPPQLTQSNLLFRSLGKTQPLDEVETLEVLIKLQTDQIADMAFQAQLQEDAVPLEEIRRSIQLLGKLCMDSVELKIKTGRMNAPKQSFDFNVTERLEIPDIDARSAAKITRVFAAAAAAEPEAVAQAFKEIEDEEGSQVH